MGIFAWKSSNDRVVALSLLAAVLTANAVGLAPELTISRVDLNDNVMHYPLIAGMVQAIERGDNPFDWWAPEWSLGYPVLRTYQPLGHAIVASAYFALFKSVSLMTVFVWVRYLSVALLPLTFFITARLLSRPPLTAAAAAILSPLISTQGLYGIEYGSYLWAGSGLFAQAIACHFTLLTIGFAYRAIRNGRLLAVTGLLLGLTFLAHFIYGYIAALTICLLALMPDRDTPRAARIGRTVWVGAIAFVVAAFELLPLWLDGSIINHSLWEMTAKWDSFGAIQVTKWLFTGELLDHGRLPVLTLLAAAGAVMYFRDVVDLRKSRDAADTFILLGATLWILMFFGRPFWGPLLTLAGVLPDVQLHRVIGGVHIFLVLLAATQLSAMWRALSGKIHIAAVALITIILLFPMVRERERYLANNRKWGYASLTAYEANRPAIEKAVTMARERGGRAFAGLAASWGRTFKIGDPTLYAYLSEARMPALSLMFHSMSLTSEIMTLFDETDAVQYRLFDVRTVIAPSNGSVRLARFLAPLLRTGPLEIYAAPGNSHFDIVDAAFAVKTSRNNFYDINDRWMSSDWVANRRHLLLDFYDDAPGAMERIPADAPLPPSAPHSPPGAVLYEHQEGDEYRAEVQAARDSYVLFKETWHKNWRALVDGQPVRTAMLSPGFVGIPVAAGRHRVSLNYQPEKWQAILAAGGFLIGLFLIALERRRLLPEVVFPRFVATPRVRIAFGLAILALPVCASLATSRLPLGHDATEYLPRVVEFHQNISNGILLPRWAPDLSHGAGQPLFLFNPPMFYYLAEFWHLLGFDFVVAMNLACIAIVVATAVGSFLLGRLHFGDAGGWIASAACLYAPYFAVDLYVRTAWAEFAAFPFFVFSLYAFGAYVKERRRAHLLLGASAFAGVLISHNAAALLFAPLLAVFICVGAWTARSWKVLAYQSGALALALALAAFVWIPSLLMQKFVQVAKLIHESNYTDHFVYLHQFFDSAWGYGVSVPGDQDGMSFDLGSGHMALMLIAIAGAIRFRRAIVVPWVGLFAGAALVLCWMMTANAGWIWADVPMLQIVSFPWRWLGPVAVAIAACAAAVAVFPAFVGRWKWEVLAGAMLLLILPNTGHLHPKDVQDVDLRFWSPEEIATRGVEVTSFDEYRPVWMRTLPLFNPRRARVVSGDAEIHETGRSPLSWSGRVDAVTPAIVEMSTAYFPGWSVRVDGNPVAALPSDGLGLIRFQTPPGNHQVAVTWNRTATVWIADGISSLALCVWAFCMWLALRKTRSDILASGGSRLPARSKA